MRLVIVGGSDAGISAGLRARQLDPAAEVTLVVADAYPNYSICGIPYYISGEVGDWRNLAHRTRADLDAAGLQLRLDTRAVRIDPAAHRLHVTTPELTDDVLKYDALVVGTGAVPVVPPIAGLSGFDALGPADGVHLLHSMGDTLALDADLRARSPGTALVVGAGYIGLEMAEALTMRGIRVVQVEQQPEVLPTVDPELGEFVRGALSRYGVQVHTSTRVTGVSRADNRLRVDAAHQGPGSASTDSAVPLSWDVDPVLVVVGVRPDTELLTAAGARTGPRGAVAVDDTMATGLPSIWAAGDCVTTDHRLLGRTYLPLGTTAHKQGRVAGANAVGHRACYRGSLGTQVVKVFDLVAARTGLRDHEATAVGYAPATTATRVDDHKAYYPHAHPISIRVTGDTVTGQLLGAQLVGSLGTEVAKRVDTYATALFHRMAVDEVSDLDLSYTPPLGSPWDAVQMAAQSWVDHHQPVARTESTPEPARSTS